MKTAQIVALISLLCIPAARLYSQQVGNDGQATGPGEPLAPLDERESTSVGGLVASEAPDSARVEPDTHTLSGVQTFGLGSLRSQLNMFDPSLLFLESGSKGTSPSGLNSITTLGGNLSFSRSSSRQQLSLAYTGGVNLYNGVSTYKQQYDQFAFSQEASRGRWTLGWGDDLMFSSQGSFFGGLATGGFTFGAQTGPVSGLQPSLVPSLTILTGAGRSLDDSAFAEADYAVSRQTALTVSGSYGLLHFLDSGYVDGHQIGGRIGYDYIVGSGSSIGLSYSYNRTAFGGANQRMQSHSTQLAYGRKIVGQLAFQAAGGPVLLKLENYGAFGGQRWSWSVYSGLTYGLRLTTYSLSYSYGVSMGSGVLFGANSSVVTASAGRTLRRFWTASVSAAYARNVALAPSAVFSNRFDNWYTNVTAGRQLGRQLHFDLNYGFQEQRSSSGTCPVVSCGISPKWQVFGVSASWHPLLGRR